MIKINHALLGLLALGSLTIGGCSSSTSTNPPAVASLTTPATIDFGNVSTGEFRDTTFTVSTTSSDSITITGFGFSSANIKDAIDNVPLRINRATQSGVLHVSLSAADTGAVAGYDTIHYSAGSNTGTAVVKVIGRGINRVAGAGSTFVFDSSSYDSTKGMNGATSTETYTVLQNNFSIGGKTNVIMVRRGVDTSYYHMEANGDISKYLQLKLGAIFSVQPQWLTLPVASHTDQSLTIKDTSITYSGIPITIHTTVVAKYAGDESVSVAGQPMNTQKAIVTVTISGGLAETAIVTSTIWYAPSISFYPKSTEYDNYSGLVINQKTFKSESMTSFQLK